MAGVAGFGPANLGVKVPCLTTWRYPYMVADPGLEPEHISVPHSRRGVSAHSTNRPFKIRQALPDGHVIMYRFDMSQAMTALVHIVALDLQAAAE